MRELLTPARGAWWAVGILGVLYILSFVDRIILALLVEPLKRDLGVSDVQLGLLFGPAFAVFYAMLGVPVARIADRGNRTRLVFAGVMLWGLATVASGFAGSYWQLVVLRVGLAIGEAALTPAAYSLIGDLFPPHRRAFAASVYSGLGMAGSSGAYILGALVIQVVGSGAAVDHAPGLQPWQLVLILVGVPALLVGVLFALTVREPARKGGPADAPPLSAVVAHLRLHGRLYGGLFAGAGLIQAIGAAYSAWGAEYLRRTFDWPIQQAGLAFGLAGLFAGLCGTLTAPFVTRAFERSGRADAIALTAMSGLVLGATCAVAAPLQVNPYAFLALKALSSFFLIGATNSVLVQLQVLAPDRMRATMVALLLMCIGLLGLGLGPPAAAIASTMLNPTGDSLGLALAIIAPAIGGPALLLLLWSRPALAAMPTADEAPR